MILDFDDEAIIESLKKAGEITSEAREYAKNLIREDALLLDATQKIEARIIELGGAFAFPPQISINKIAAHYCCPVADDSIFKENDLVKVDLGAQINGYVGDTAVSVDLSKDGRHKELIEASKEALKNAIDMIHPGQELGKIGKVIEETINSHGYLPVRNLSGHGVGRFSVHEPPSIPNFDNGDESILKKGHVIAIEPFATDGAGLVVEGGNAQIHSLTNKKPVRNIIVRNILKEIEKYKGLPFTPRWLSKKFPVFKVDFALKELSNLGSITSYPPLSDKNSGYVSQTEHTILVDEKPIVLTR